MKVWPYNLFEFLGINTRSTDKEDVMHAIVCATSSLPEKEWKTLLFRFTCGYNDELIAKKVGTTPRTVQNMLERVKNTLTSEPASILLCFGYSVGMKLVKSLLNSRSENPLAVPIGVAFPEQPLQSYLVNANFECMADVKEMSDDGLLAIKGIGKKYLETIRERESDFSRMQRVNSELSADDSDMNGDNVMNDNSRIVETIPITVIDKDSNKRVFDTKVSFPNTDTVQGCLDYMELAAADKDPEKAAMSIILMHQAHSNECTPSYDDLIEEYKDPRRNGMLIVSGEFNKSSGVTV